MCVHDSKSLAGCLDVATGGKIAKSCCSMFVSRESSRFTFEAGYRWCRNLNRAASAARGIFVLDVRQNARHDGQRVK